MQTSICAQDTLCRPGLQPVACPTSTVPAPLVAGQGQGQRLPRCPTKERCSWCALNLQARGGGLIISTTHKVTSTAHHSLLPTRHSLSNVNSCWRLQAKKHRRHCRERRLALMACRHDECLMGSTQDECSRECTQNECRHRMSGALTPRTLHHSG